MDCNISLFFRSSLGLCAERPHHNARGLIVDSFSQVECRDLFFEIWLHAPCAWFPGKWFAWQIASLCVARSAGPTKSWQTQRRSQRVEGVKDVQVRTNTFAWEVVGGGGWSFWFYHFFTMCMNLACINSRFRNAIVSAFASGCQNPGSSFGVWAADQDWWEKLVRISKEMEALRWL